MDEETAAVMLTNPNTLGMFETEILKITEIVHKRGGLVYCDGANLNAVMGKTKMKCHGNRCFTLQFTQDILHSPRRGEDLELAL